MILPAGGVQVQCGAIWFNLPQFGATWVQQKEGFWTTNDSPPPRLRRGRHESTRMGWMGRRESSRKVRPGCKGWKVEGAKAGRWRPDGAAGANGTWAEWWRESLVPGGLFLPPSYSSITPKGDDATIPLVVIWSRGKKRKGERKLTAAKNPTSPRPRAADMG